MERVVSAYIVPWVFGFALNFAFSFRPLQAMASNSGNAAATISERDFMLNDFVMSYRYDAGSIGFAQSLHKKKIPGTPIDSRDPQKDSQQNVKPNKILKGGATIFRPPVPSPSPIPDP
jgi:hypothetical protein